MSGDREGTLTNITECLVPRMTSLGSISSLVFTTSLMTACSRQQMVSLSYDSSLSQTVGADITSIQTMGACRMRLLTMGACHYRLHTAGADHTSLPMAGACLYSGRECLPSPLTLGA